jgi:hypothetical protein
MARTTTLTLTFVAVLAACAVDDAYPGPDDASSTDSIGDEEADDSAGNSAGESDDEDSGTDSSPGDDSDTGSDETGEDTGSGDDGSDDGDPEPEDDIIALFAINEGNFNGDVDQGIWSIMTGCANVSFDAYMAKVNEYPELDDAKHFVTGWSCGATYALIRGYEHADVFKGIVHLNQASTPYVSQLDAAFANGGNVRVPVFLIHDFSYDAGGQLTIQWLESKGYQEGVDLFIMDRPGTGHEPYLTDDEKDILAEWFQEI